ncbi:hypothetical protein PoB_007108400 [Plakobranchus ocellatus]|uniref:Uncharacterized protein n=1 Tax=Plakobranchus ocellatus TaxID=259542 RepID=A0AAV4DKM3_9GAST|nr:hypothetical protein PoB_007108400 [Plakobranchus ocellatus]
MDSKWEERRTGRWRGYGLRVGGDTEREWEERRTMCGRKHDESEVRRESERKERRRDRAAKRGRDGKRKGGETGHREGGETDSEWEERQTVSNRRDGQRLKGDTDCE